MAKQEYTVGQTLYASQRGFGSAETPIEAVVVKVRKNRWADCTTVPGGNAITFTPSGDAVGTKGDRFNTCSLIEKERFDRLKAEYKAMQKTAQINKTIRDLGTYSPANREAMLNRIDALRSLIEAE